MSQSVLSSSWTSSCQYQQHKRLHTRLLQVSRPKSLFETTIHHLHNLYDTYDRRYAWLPQAAADSRICRRILFAENPPKNTDIWIIKWNRHSYKWLACYLKWIILVISKLLVITDGCRLYNIKETDNNSHFSLGSTAQPKLFVMSRILAEYFSFSLKRDNSATSNISRFFSSHPYFFHIADWGSIRMAELRLLRPRVLWPQFCPFQRTLLYIFVVRCYA